MGTVERIAKPLSENELEQVRAHAGTSISYGWGDPDMSVDAGFNLSADDHYGRGTLRLLATIDALTASQPKTKICAANRSADPPQDCDWPFCGCDEHANKVIEAVGNVRDQRQNRMMTWGAVAFGTNEILSVEQRGYRHMEEAIEAGQSAGCKRDKTHKLVDYIFDRPPGALHQEIGGSGVTLLVLAAAAGISADAEEEREMKRVLSKPIEHFTARNKAKNDAGFVAEAIGGVDTKAALKAAVDEDQYRRAVEIVVESGNTSTSYVQRKLELGYNRAATLMQLMEAEGIVSAPDKFGKRTVLRDATAAIPVLDAAELRDKATEA